MQLRGSSLTSLHFSFLSGRLRNKPACLSRGGGVSAPKPLNHPSPEYSEEARAARFQGTCVLSVVVNKEGKTEEVSVVRRLGMGLDEKAVAAVRTWTFEPAQKDGKPVAVLINVAVSFHLGNGPGPGVRLSPQDIRRMAEEKRRVEDRVYSAQKQAPAPTCNQSHGNEAALVSLPGLKPRSIV